MYCSSCGNALTDGLIFCNKCGKRLKSDKEPRPDGGLSEASTNFLIAAMLGIPIAGIGVMIGLLTVMKKELGFPNDMIALIALMGFGLLIAAECGFLFLLISRARSARKDARENAQAQLNEAKARTLGEAQYENVARPAAVSSVTENTTRNFAPINREN